MSTLSQLLSGADVSLNAERQQRLESALVQDHAADMPWYLRFIVGFGAWLASLFFIGFFIFLIGWQDQHRSTIGIFGIVLLGASIVVYRLKPGLFVTQCSLATSLAGQFMLYYGFLPTEHHTLESAAFFSIALAAILYGLYPDLLQRLITCTAALQITLAWLYLGNNGGLFDSPGEASVRQILVLSIYWAFHLIGIAACLIPVHRRSVLLAPLGYAFVVSLAAWQLQSLQGLWLQLHTAAGPLWLFGMRPIFSAAALLGGVTWAAGGLAAWKKFPLSFAALIAALGLMLWLGAAGILPALFLITLGFFLQSRIIQIIGLILLPVFLSRYYYALQLDLMIKAMALAGTGLILLLLRAGLKRWFTSNSAEVS